MVHIIIQTIASNTKARDLILKRTCICDYNSEILKKIERVINAI